MSYLKAVARMQGHALKRFGEQVTYHPDGLADVEVRGIFKPKGGESEMQMEVGARSLNPVLDVRIADLPQRPTSRDRVTVRGDTYQVLEFDEDGMGMMSLTLHREPIA